MGRTLILLNGGTRDDNREVFENLCRTVKDKIGPALAENETVLFRAEALDPGYDLEGDIALTDEILRRKRTGLFRHLRMASSFDVAELGETEKYRIQVDVFFLDHFINIKIFDLLFDSVLERIPNSIEVLCIYRPYEKDERYGGFQPHARELHFVLQPSTAQLPVPLIRLGDG